jgi:hypothetical protein
LIGFPQGNLSVKQVAEKVKKMVPGLGPNLAHVLKGSCRLDMITCSGDRDGVSESVLHRAFVLLCFVKGREVQVELKDDCRLDLTVTIKPVWRLDCFEKLV